MNSISSIGSNSMMHNMNKPNPAEMAEELFSKIDSSDQGYIDKAGLQSAFDEVSSTTDIDALFSELDGNDDGKVTQDEFTNSMAQLEEQLMRMRMESGGMPPPPPNGEEGNETGFTLEELTSQLAEIDSTDSERSEFISNIIDNFEAADADGDGKVSFDEAKTLNQGSETEPASMDRMPPPPPPGRNGDDTGFTKDELTSQLEEIGSTDSERSSLISNIIENFDEADIDGDGKVSFKEAMDFDQDNDTSSVTNSTLTASTESGEIDRKVAMQVMQLLQAYNLGDDSDNQISSLLSVSA